MTETAAALARVTNEQQTFVIDKNLREHLRVITYSVAKQALAEEQARGFDPDPIVVTDRSYGRPEIMVKHGGRIEYHAHENVREIVEWIFRQLIMRSPLASGRYAGSHILMVNGVQHDFDLVGGGIPFFSEIEDTDRIQIVNTTPYARRIERGWSQMTPRGVYRVVHGMARRRFGRLAFIDLKWVKLNLGYNVRGWSNQHQTRRILRPQIYPAIQIKPSRGTVTHE